VTHPILCVYHANCADGLVAAWAVHRALGPDVDYKPANYGDRIDRNRVLGKDVLIVDFSYPLSVLRAIAQEARSVLVLDHHATSQADLATLTPPTTWIGDQETCPAPYATWLTDADAADQPLAAIFDMDRSGAGITWDYLHRCGKTHTAQSWPRPRIVDLVEDRDLWRFQYGDESRAFHAVLASYDWTDLPAMFARLDEWGRAQRRHDVIALDLKCESIWEGILSEGHAILRAHRQSVAAAVRATRRTMSLAGHVVPVACVPAGMASDAGQLLNQPLEGNVNNEAVVVRYVPSSAALRAGETRPFFSATYYDGADGLRHFSLRSPPGGADVGKIAQQIAESFNQRYYYGREAAAKPWSGGGHEHAAGFDAPLGWEGE
jgi:hypothetical protein